MPLIRQTASISFEQGVGDKDDPKQRVPGKASVLENAVFTSRKRIQKRNGHEALGRTNVHGADLVTSASALFTLKDELVVSDGAALYSRSEAQDAWAFRGALLRSVDLALSPVVRDARSQRAQDLAVHSSGIVFVAYEDVVGGFVQRVGFTAVDAATRATVASSPTTGYTGVTRPRVACVGNTFFLFFADAGVLKYQRFSALTLDVAGPIATVGDLGSGAYDVRTIGSRVVIARDLGAGFTVVSSRDESGAGGGDHVIVSPATAISVFPGHDGAAAVVAWYDGAAVKFQVRSADLTSVSVATATVETIANVTSLTGHCGPAAGALYYSVSAASAGDHHVRSAYLLNHVAGAPAVHRRSVALASKAFAFASQATGAVWLCHESSLQPTYFLTAGGPGSGSAPIVAKAAHGTAGGHPEYGFLASVDALEGRARFPLLVTDQIRVEGGAFTTSTGVAVCDFAASDPVRSYLRAELGEALHLSGGFLAMYDGGSAAEHGFHLYPEGLTVPNPGGALVYQYVALYEWVDHQGRRHRSAPSPAVTHADGTAISGAHTVAVTVPSLRLTAKTRANVVLYRTIANGTIFYYVGAAQNSPNADTVPFTDATTDAALQGNEQLYTTGGVIENIAPNACSAMWVGQSRLFLVDAEDPTKIWFSKQVLPGQPVEFSDLLTFNVMPLTGPVIAGAELDGKQILFRERAISFFVGDGPDATGGGAGFSQEQIIPTAIGCKNPRALVVTPAGILFQANEGFHLLDRSLNVSYVGADVEGDNDETVTSGLIIPGVHQVRFTLGNGTALVYDYLQGQWSRFTGIAAVDATIWRGRVCHARADGDVWRETPGAFSDPGSTFVKMKAVLSWLNLAGLQGFQRVYRLLVLGEYKSAHNLLVRIAYATADAGFEADFTQEVTIPAGEPYQFRVACAKQKCEAIRISIEDVSTGTAGESLSLSALALEVGVKKGAAKLPAARTFG